MKGDPTFRPTKETMNSLRMRCSCSKLFASTLAIAASSMLAGCASSHSNSNERDFNRRIYVGGGLLLSELEPNADDNPDYSVAETSSSGGSLLVGYDINNRLSVEGHLASLGAAEMNPSGEIEYKVGALSAIVYGLNDRVDRDRRKGFALYARGGVGYMENASTNNVPFERIYDIHVTLGVGVEYGFDSGLGVRGELVSADTDAQYAQLGLLYRFGESSNRSDTRTIDSREPQSIREPVTTVPPPAPVAVAPTDGDRDGVPDTIDQCLDTAYATPVNEVGCDYFNGVIEGVNFETGSDRLTARAIDILTSVASTLVRFPAIRVSIEAHTDSQGSASSNLALSKRRAISVARFLVSQGVSVSRLRPMALGESRPRASNSTSEGRAMNRRVEFQIVR